MWEKAFVNYLPVIPGMNGNLLAYIVCKDLKVDNKVEYEGEYLTFNDHTIARGPHTGQLPVIAWQAAYRELDLKHCALSGPLLLHVCIASSL